jgi:hypothetical protein
MAHGRGTTQLIHDPAARSQKPCVRAVCFHPHIHPRGSETRAGDFSCRYLVRSTPPRQDGAARACRDLPAFWGGSAARDEERNVRACTRSRFTNRRTAHAGEYNPARITFPD